MALVTKKPQKLNVFEAIFFDVAFNKDVTQFAMQICIFYTNNLKLLFATFSQTILSPYSQMCDFTI